MNRIHLILNIACAAAIVLLLALIATSGRRAGDALADLTPPDALLGDARDTPTGAGAAPAETDFSQTPPQPANPDPPQRTETQLADVVEQRGFDNIGKEPIFKTIIPKPTPVPTPTPKPPDPPKNAEIVANWSLMMIDPDAKSAIFIDQQTQDNIVLTVGGEPHRMSFKSLMVNIHLIEVGDFSTLSATINSDVDKSPHVFKLF